MAGGSWSPTSLPTRPGLYINFQSAATAQIQGGARGVVAIPLATYTGATAKTFYTITSEKEAVDTFGSANIQSIKFALQGGAKEVLVYTMPASPTATDFSDMRAAFDARPFNVFVYDGASTVSTTEQTNTLTWVNTNKADGKHFFVVFGAPSATAASDDLAPATGNTRSTTLNSDYAINLISGVIIDGTTYTSNKFASYIAGLVAGTAINKSITYAVVPVTDVTLRMTNAQIKTAIAAGSLVLVNDGEKTRVEQGITTSVKKVRAIRARQAVSTDVSKTAADSYIGQIDNNDDGQKALIGAVQSYLERLETANVLTDISVSLDPNYESTGDTVYLLVSYTEIDSVERIFLTINI